MIVPGLSHTATIMAVLFVAVAWWEHARPDRRCDIAAGPRWFCNLALFAIRNGLAACLPLTIAASGIATWLPAPVLPRAETSIGVALHLATVLLLLDLGNYLMHRALHASPLLWRLHAVHHSDLDLDITTSLRGHPLEAVFTGLGLAGIGALLGASSAEFASYGVLVFGIQLVAHANLRLPPRIDTWLRAVVITPDFHRIHHSRERRECDANFGAVIMLWDRSFGTARVPTGRDPAAFGSTEHLEPRFQRLGTMLLQPFLRSQR